MEGRQTGHGSATFAAAAAGKRGGGGGVLASLGVPEGRLRPAARGLGGGPGRAFGAFGRGAGGGADLHARLHGHPAHRQLWGGHPHGDSL